VLNESAGTELCSPLEPGQPVFFTVDIGVAAYASNDNPAKLELWGGATSCAQDELLWTSPVIEDAGTWHTFCGVLNPSQRYEHLMLWPVQAAGASTYLIVDNFRPATSCD